MRTIRLGTLFSGIGAIEQAMKKKCLPHSIVFACDNGERELKLLPDDVQRSLDYLKKIPVKKLSKVEKSQLSQLMAIEQNKYDAILNEVKHLSTPVEKKKYVDNLYTKYSSGENLVKQTYLANYEIDENDFYSDVRLFDGCDYRDQVDIMVGGSPCQSFSSNGKRGGVEDTRGTLFYDYARIISEVKPKCFIFENVGGMLLHDKGKTWSTIKQIFKELEYYTYINHNEKGEESPLLDACDYGIPQTRKRVFLIGVRNDIKLKKDFHFPAPIKLEKTNMDYLDTTVSAKYYLGEKGFRFVTNNPTRAQVGRKIQKCQKANQQFNWNGDFIFEPLDTSKHNKEILERAYVGDWNGQKGVIRMYTPRECLRLMGFPDSFKMLHCDNVMWRQSGNSIVVNVLEEIINELIKTGIFE